MFKERLKQIREENNLSQKMLSDALGIPQQTYSNWERGRAQPDLEMLMFIAEYFDVTADWLLGRDMLVAERQNPEIAELLKDGGIERLRLARQLSVDEIKTLVALKNNIIQEIGKTNRLQNISTVRSETHPTK